MCNPTNPTNLNFFIENSKARRTSSLKKQTFSIIMFIRVTRTKFILYLFTTLLLISDSSRQ